MELKIEKMIYGGDGLARMPADASGRSKTVFVPFVLDGESVSAVLTEEKTGFNRAQAGRVLSPSPHRTLPPCEYFYNCGGCQYQHISYEHQLEIKASILLETLKRTARINWEGPLHTHASPPWNYRNRTRLHVKSGAGFALGYFRHGSRELLPVMHCPISSPLVNQVIEKVWQIGREGRVPKSIHEIEFFADAADQALLLEVHSAYEPETAAQQDLRRFAEEMGAAFPTLTGTSAFATGSSLFPWDSAAWSYGGTHLDYISKHGKYRVQAGSFFQTNRFLLDTLADLVCRGRSGQQVLDLYAGTGLFSLPLSKGFAQVVAVESSPPSFADLEVNVPEAERHRMTVEEFLRHPPLALKPDYVVVDPPRTGLEEKVAKGLARLAAPQLTYVSCDPATLSRDLRLLIESGYLVEDIHLVDLFPQTFHLETVVHLALRP